MGVLCQSLVAHLGKAETPLHDAEYVFDLSTDTGITAVVVPFVLGQFSMPIAFVLGEVSHVGRTIGNGPSLPDVGRITPHPGFLSMQQITPDYRVMDIGGSGHHHIIKKLLFACFLAVSLEAIGQRFCFIGDASPVNGLIHTLSRES